MATQTSTDTKLSTGAIAGISIGALVGCGILLALIIWLYRRYQRNKPLPKFTLVSTSDQLKANSIF